ncbi:hypothetical protein [Paenibacillus sp. Leaf72]|uniref:hypothetical protein n=1 Tax=Paenibacillus sp. Leaf72 TaxID=1736234 RepID=UPI0006F9FA19|nr:hypothetical protein [Paenibacillus sp. Leaf72]KQN96785.1 hypothetical protein ASF12_22190 [Paenibacillus sp. Leaf72]
MKKFASIMFTLMFLFSSVSVASAKEEASSQQDLINLLNKYGFEATQDSSIIATANETLKINNLEELEIQLKEFKKSIQSAKSNAEEEILIPVSPQSKLNSFSSLAATTYNDSHVNSWWCPGNALWGGTAITITCNIAYDYSYSYANGNAYFTSASNFTSYLGGIHIYTWVGTNHSYNFTTTNSPGDTMKIKTLGYYLLGITWNNIPIGATLNDEWNASLRLY